MDWEKSLLVENIIRLTVNENNCELVAALIRTYQMTGHRARTGLKKIRFLFIFLFEILLKTWYLSQLKQSAKRQRSAHKLLYWGLISLHKDDVSSGQLI